MFTIRRIAFTASTSFASDANIFSVPLGIVRSTPGFVSAFRGLQIDDGKTGYFITGGVYSDFQAALRPAATGEFEVHHVHADAVNPTTALSAPTTEFVLFTLKTGVAPAEISPFFDDLAHGLNAASGAHPPCLWAPSKVSGNHILVFVGWDTVQVCIINNLS
ncbi:hypothetical protein DFH08DRAFT_1018827 [Mycena albidolilacea]|uniref:Uncharacterized protein n=1 Tax=Mycena albidolilacea TaxID=1033008 RepID=A0AAD7EMU0_9AGAR|nr:hypothetical protein DFH08DRAFT_1018827 [Mycena albidolilacea]